MKICTNCGRECDNNLKICPKCGWGLKDAVIVSTFENIEVVEKKDSKAVVVNKEKRSYSDTEKSASRLGFLLCWILPSLLAGNLIYFVSVWDLLKNLAWCFATPLIIGLMCYTPRTYERSAFIKSWGLCIAIQAVAILIAVLVIYT